MCDMIKQEFLRATGRELLQQGRVTEAGEIYLELHKECPGDVEALESLAIICLALEEFSQALDYSLEILEYSPASAEAALLAYMACRALGDEGNAERYIERAKKSLPENRDHESLLEELEDRVERYKKEGN